MREFRSQLTTQEVVRLQRALATLGYYHGPVDGLAAPGTWDAVIDWARDRGWEAPSTLRSAHVAALEKELAGRGVGAQNPDSQSPGASDPTVQRVQAGLVKLGYYAGPVDGQSSAATLSALAAWAKDRGWTAPKTIRQAHADNMEQEIASRAATAQPAPAQVIAQNRVPGGQNWTVSESDQRASQSCVAGKYEKKCISLACDIERGFFLDLSVFRKSDEDRPVVTLRVDDGQQTAVTLDILDPGPTIDGEGSGLFAQMLSGRALTTTTADESLSFPLGGFAGEYERVKNECDVLLTRLRSGENPYAGRLKRLPDEVAALPDSKESWVDQPNVDFAGADIRSGLKDPLLRALDEGQCARLCSETEMCLAYTFNPTGGTCFLKSGTGRMTPFAGAKSGRFTGSKARFAPPPTDGPGPVVDGSVRWRPDDTLAGYQARVRTAAQKLGGTCEEEEAALSALAEQLKWTFSTDTSARVGEAIRFEWSGNTLAERIPVWIVVHSKAVRFSGKGHIALGPSAPNPFAIKAGEGETRALVSLATRGAGAKGAFDILPLVAGRQAIAVDVVGYIRGCQKEIALKAGEQTFDIKPSRAEIVLNTPDGRAAFTDVIEVPEGSREIFLNEKRFLLRDTQTGTEIVERAGSNLLISPTHRFIAVDQNGRTDIVDMIDGKTTATIDSGNLRWALGDSVVFTTSVPWGMVNLSSTFGSFLDIRAQMTGPSCCEAGRGNTRVGIDLENAAFSIWGNLGYRVGALQNTGYASISDAQGGYSSEGGETLAINMNTFWSLGLVSPVSMARDLDVAGGFIFAADYRDQIDETKEGSPPRPFADRLSRTLDRVGLTARTLDAVEVRRLAEAGNSKPLKETLPEQLARLGIELDPMTDGRHSVEVDQAWEKRSLYAGEFAARLERSKTAMGQMQADADAAGWKTSWAVPEDEAMQNDCEHLMLEESAGERRIPLPRDVVEVATVRTPRGASWVARATCVAGATLGSLRPYNAIYYIDFAAPLRKGGKAVLLEASFFFENAGQRLWYEHPFEIKANDALLVSYAPGNGVITVVDRQTRKFLWIGENLPNGDLLTDAWLTGDRRFAVQLNSDGNFYLHSLAKKGETPLSGRIVDDEVAIWTADYHYDATAEAASIIDLKFPGQPGQFSLDRFGPERRVRDLAQMVLAQKWTSPEGGDIGVPPSLDGSLSGDGPERMTAALDYDGQRVTRLSVFQDGVLTDTFDLQGAAVAGHDISFARLKDARWISVIASSADALASLPVSVDAGPPAQQRSVNRVLAIGINTYENEALPSLNYALRDAGLLLDVLGHPQGAGPAFTVVEGPKDRRATPDAILSATEKLLAGLSRGDHAVLFLAGHGLQDEKGRFYFATSATDPADLEHTALPFDRLSAVLERTEARVTVLLDACHSGLVGNSIAATNDDLANNLARLKSNITVLAAAKGRQQSQGRYETGGLFTHAIADVLGADRGQYDRNGNGRIEASELYRGVKALVVDQSEGQQTPWIINSRLVGDYALF
ncbi:caspase family protein [Rhizobium sp. ZK1]|uniref:caspase family protein n=1 Tax=Rhizobium sp. ZK1 TaxID=3389872 RepID=UPI0039F6A78C